MRALLLTGFFLATAAHSVVAADPPSVKTTRPSRADIHRWITLPGNLRANQQATLYAKVAGYVTKLTADKGDEVKADQVLAELEVPELLADVQKYEADVKVAEIELGRLTEAQKKAPDLILPQALDKARAATDVAHANIRRTRTLLDFAKITAPFTGVITERFIDRGAFVPAATSGRAEKSAAIFTLMDFTTIRAQTSVPELETPYIQNGLPVKVSAEAFPGKTWEATVTRNAGALDERARLMPVEVDLPNPGGTLKPGMYATLKIAVEKHANVLVVPVEALVMEKTAAFVFKLADGKARKTAVKLGFQDGTQAEILEGASQSDTLILAGKLPLTDGQPVNAEAAK